MLDIAFIRTNSQVVKNAAKNKGITVDIDRILVLDTERRELLQRVEQFRMERNAASKAIGEEKDPTARKAAIEAMQQRKDSGTADEEKLRVANDEFEALLLLVPQIPAVDTPVGNDDAANVLVKTVGKIPSFSFAPKDHITLGAELDIIDTERGVQTSGFRGYYLKGFGARLQWAIMQLGFDELVKSGALPMIPPTLVKGSALTGSGHFPFGKDEIYEIANPGTLRGEKAKEPMYLTGTSESSILAYYADRRFTQDELPVRVAGFSPCYRSEVGSYGKDAKGLYRLHEFWKIEQLVLCEATLEESEKHFAAMLKIVEGILAKLELPYRVVNVCTGDMGAGKYRMYDVETYMPSRKAYGETHSDSMLLEWQARRLNIRYTDAQGTLQYVHTLNNTGIASPRILIAFLENHQQKDGSVRIPKALQKYLGAKIIAPKKQ